MRLSLPLACLLLIGASGAHAQQGLQVRAQDGLLSVQASNTSASELAQVLSQQLGISVVVTGDTEARVNIDIVEEPLDKALAKLSPNHLLVRSSELPDSSIVEVVLMMGDEGSSGGGGEEQFLPSGSPADDIVVAEEEQQLPTDDAPIRDPDRAEQVRAAAEAAANDAVQEQQDSSELPAPDSFDPVTGMPIDPATGLPLE